MSLTFNPRAEVRRHTEKSGIELPEATIDELDREIAAIAQNWDISRMAVIDRNVLRMATWELLHCKDIPPKVAINEAIELGKRYSTQKTGAFVNAGEGWSLGYGGTVDLLVLLALLSAIVGLFGHAAYASTILGTIVKGRARAQELLVSVEENA